jgi:phenylalanyl-tRNA synthetase alpha chain
MAADDHGLCVMVATDELAGLNEEAASRLGGAASLHELEELETEYLGRSRGRLSLLMQGLRTLPPEQKPVVGQRLNAIKREIEALIVRRRAELAAEETERRLRAEAIDITLPGRAPAVGRRHPLTATFDRVTEIMVGLGFRMVDGPEVEHYNYNYAALNFPEEHPAMDEQASFYVAEQLLLRTQTTALQGRVMPSLAPPFRIFTLGRCFRYEAVDATHSHTFHQVDAFLVDRKVSLADLKGTLHLLARELFGQDVVMRFRPDFFPFVEPGVEVAIRRGAGWLELGGAGMIHPNVLRGVGLDPEEWTGYAFGLGLDRMPMLRYGIDDIRLFFENDLRLLRQF